jgi:hypothetical protein
VTVGPATGDISAATRSQGPSYHALFAKHVGQLRRSVPFVIDRDAADAVMATGSAADARAAALSVLG